VWRWIEHTSEVELEVRAASEREVFEEALAALAELVGIGEGASSARAERRAVVVETERAGDLAALLAGWLEELVFLAESEGFVATEMARFELHRSRLDATVIGGLGDPPPLVKAVTLHGLRFDEDEDGYLARVVLDV
jgi:SHS2 domain-containing protein